MKKETRMAAFVEQLGTTADEDLDPCYVGFFTCFNEQRYYEAHDVLEHLWLRKKDDDHLYFKGLIQVAGAFVHMQKQFQRPLHPKDGRRLRPAVRLLQRAIENLESYRPHRLGFDVATLCLLCAELSAQIVESDFQFNPWNPARAPHLTLKSTE